MGKVATWSIAIIDEVTYPNYEVSDDGRVRNLSGRELKLIVGSGGYLSVSLYLDRKEKRVRVSRLVLTSFRGEPDEARPFACHSNGDVSNNSLSNLYWGSYQDNNRDTVDHGNHRNSRKARCPKGHPYDDANTYEQRTVRYKTSRVCKRCGVEEHRTPEYYKRRLEKGDFKHGTNGYRIGCRCDECKKARSDYDATYKARKAQR